MKENLEDFTQEEFDDLQMILEKGMEISSEVFNTLLSRCKEIIEDSSGQNILMGAMLMQMLTSMSMLLAEIDLKESHMFIAGMKNHLDATKELTLIMYKKSLN